MPIIKDLCSKIYNDPVFSIIVLILTILFIVLSPILIIYYLYEYFFPKDQDIFGQAVIDDNIEIVERYINDPKFDILSKLYYLKKHYPVTCVQLIIYERKNEIMKLLLSSVKLQDFKDELKDYLIFSIMTDKLNDDVHQLTIDKLKYFNIFHVEIIETLIGDRKHKLIEDNIDYFMRDIETIFEFAFEKNNIDLLDILYDKGVNLPSFQFYDKEFTIKGKINMKIILCLERFENFDDFFMKNKYKIIRACDNETMDYLYSKY